MRANLPALSVVLLMGCAQTGPIVATPAPLSCLSGQQTMIRDALSFGLSIPGGGTVSDSAWDAFLAEQVTPAFPNGFTVVAAAGQWREASGSVAREPSRILIAIHPPSAEADRSLAAIRADYLLRFRQEAVMWERSTACVGF